MSGNIGKIKVNPAGKWPEDKLRLQGQGNRRAAPSTMSGRVHLALRRAIISMQLKPGDSLSEAEIARQLGTSRQPVREAFIKLAETGFVEIVPQRGTRVRKISAREVDNARFIRQTVEVAIARRAAQSAAEEAIAWINEIVAAQRWACQTENQERFIALDDQFHQAIADSVGFANIWRVVEDLKGQMDRVRFLSLPDATPMSRLVAQHAAVAEGIAAHDPEAAGEAMDMHLSEMLNALPILAERHAEWFSD